MKKTNKNAHLTCVRVMLTKDLFEKLKLEAEVQSRKLSPMLRRIVEERYSKE